MSCCVKRLAPRLNSTHIPCSRIATQSQCSKHTSIYTKFQWRILHFQTKSIINSVGQKYHISMATRSQWIKYTSISIKIQWRILHFQIIRLINSLGQQRKWLQLEDNKNKSDHKRVSKEIFEAATLKCK